MNFRVVRRATLLVPTNRRGDSARNHLCVVMCDPLPDLQEQVLLAPISTYKEGRRGHDDTCLLEPGDHPFIRRRSFVHYYFAWQERTSALEQKVARQFYIDKGMMNEDVFRRILDGFGRSRFVKNFCREFLP